MTHTGTKRRRETMNRVEVLVQLNYGSTTCANLKNRKNSYPVKINKYTVQRRIKGEPTFAWWIRHMLAKCKHITGTMKLKYWVQTHKFGVKTPKLVQEAKECDEENGNNLWWDFICKEMKNIGSDFEVWEK